VICVTIVAIINVWEFRMGRDLFDVIFASLFPNQRSASWQTRMGFNRTYGPYGHPILAGIIFAIAYRLDQWLHWGKYWPGRLPYLPLSWARACQLWLLAGSVMTLSRGPWVGAGAAALVVFIGRSRKRVQTTVVAIFLVVAIGGPIYNAANSYVPATPDQAAGEMEQTAAYRREMNQKYIAIVEERPVWGWGHNKFPVVDGMSSIDNQFLLVALTYGEYVLAVFVLIVCWIMSRLVFFCGSHRGDVFPGSTGLMLFGIFLLVIVSITTVYLGGQTFQLFFLFLGWSEALILAPALSSTVKVQLPKLPHFEFRRVIG
jgi:hypothetical protein